jgi:hypothetical protein
MKQELNKETHKLFLMTAQGTLPPLCAALGGIVAQQILVAVTNKFNPIRQGLYLDCSSIISEEVKNICLGQQEKQDMSEET